MFELKNLPYPMDGLEPVMSEKMLQIHYGKHHQAYCDNFNKLVKENNLEEKSIEEIFSEISKYPKALENHGGGYFNHQFFWESMTPQESEENKMSDFLEEKICEDFGSFENFKEEFEKEAMAVFGSGWVWLCKDQDGKMKILKSANQESPQMDFMIKDYGNLTPILNLDVWEHAYYIDYQNVRADFVKNFWKIVNWKKVEERFKN